MIMVGNKQKISCQSNINQLLAVYYNWISGLQAK